MQYLLASFYIPNAIQASCYFPHQIQFKGKLSKKHFVKCYSLYTVVLEWWGRGSTNRGFESGNFLFRNATFELLVNRVRIKTVRELRPTSIRKRAKMKITIMIKIIITIKWRTRTPMAAVRSIKTLGRFVIINEKFDHKSQYTRIIENGGWGLQAAPLSDSVNIPSLFFFWLRSRKILKRILFSCGNKEFNFQLSASLYSLRIFSKFSHGASARI